MNRPTIEYVRKGPQVECVRKGPQVDYVRTGQLVRYSTHHRNVPVLESYNGRRMEETLQSAGRFFTTSRRLHYRSKDVPFLRTVAPFSIKR